MRIYMASTEERDQELIEEGARHRLKSFAYITDPTHAFDSMFLDSGGFTLATMGKPVDVDEYCDYLDEHGHHFEIIAALDVIGDAPASRKLYDHMRRRGHNPLPVFHYGEPLEYLEQYLREVDFVAIGGMVGKNYGALRPWLEQVFHVAREHWPCRLHSFGQMGRPIRNFPFWSCDASTWATNTRYRRGLRFDRSRGKLIGAHALTMKHLHGKKITLDRMRVTHADYEKIWRQNIRAIVEYETFLTNLWTARGITWPVLKNAAPQPR